MKALRVLIVFWVGGGCSVSSDGVDAVVDLGGDIEQFPPRDPREHPPSVIVPRGHGDVMDAIEVTALLWSADAALAPRLDRFLGWLLTSDYWKNSLAEYGVGPGVSRGVIVLPGSPPASDSAMRPVIQQVVDAYGVSVNGNSLILALLPKDAPFVDPFGNSSCSRALGYHTVMHLTDGDAGRSLAYSVNRWCNSFGGGGSWEEVTEVVGHEIAETSTIPYGAAPWYYSPFEGTWGGAVTDLCADLAVTYTVPYLAADGLPATDSYLVTRIYSNQAAQKGEDPCRPLPSPESPYFNAWLELPDGGVPYGFNVGLDADLFVKPFALGDVGKLNWRLHLYDSTLKAIPETGSNLPGDTIRVRLHADPHLQVKRGPMRLRVEVAAQAGGKNQWLDLLDVR